MARDRTTSVLLAGGVIGPLLFIAVFLIEGATRPGYSAWRNFVSQLSLSNQGWEQIANFLVCGLLCLGFARGLRRALATGIGATWGPILLAVYGFALVVAGTFSTGPALNYPPGTGVASGDHTLHGTIHGLAGLFCFTALGAACFVLARRFTGDPAWRRWAPVSIVVGVVVIASLAVSNVTSVLDMTGTWPGAPTGLVQRIGIIAGWLWVTALAWRLLSATPIPAAQPARPLSATDAGA